MTVTYITSTSEVLDIISRIRFCLIIMSIQSPIERDVEIIRFVRETQMLPILMIAANLSPTDKVMLFQAGANVCLEKPLDTNVCMAQAFSMIQLYWKAQAENQMPKPLVFGTELIINPMYRQVVICGEQLELTRTEFDLLLCLANHPGQIWSRTQLYRHVWKDDLGLGGENTVRAHLGNL